MFKGVYSATALLIAVSFGRAQQSPLQNQISPADTSEITLERKGCFGGCQVYTLTLRREGASTYVGKRSVERIGQYTAKQVYGGEFDRLSKVISDLGFFALQSDYRAEDAEKVSVTVTTPSQSKTVDTSWFARAPFALWAVVTLVDGVAANLRWEDLNQPKYGFIGPFPLRRVDPRYTEQAQRAGLQGAVVVQVEVEPDGTVSPDHITVLQGLGMGLDEKAIEAVKQWTFTPAKRGGTPIPKVINVLLEFHL